MEQTHSQIGENEKGHVSKSGWIRRRPGEGCYGLQRAERFLQETLRHPGSKDSRWLGLGAACQSRETPSRRALEGLSEEREG